MTGWTFLIIAILLEVSGTTSMKLSHGFSKLLPSILVGLFYGGAIASLTMALKSVPVSTDYAIWSGIGTALIAAIGFILFKEKATVIKLVSIFLIIAGVVGLNLVDR
jgi:small multidrug resistance pump